MSRRLLVRAIAFLVFAFLVLIAMTAQSMQRASRYEQVIGDGYYYAFSELLAGVTKLDYALEKCAYSGDDSMLALLCTEVFREAEISSRALSRLPVSELALENTTKFITQTGDYAYYLSKKASRGEMISDADRSRIQGLAHGAESLMGELRDISSRINGKSIDFTKIDFSGGDEEVIGDIKELEREFSEYPVLIYDGPFSDETDGKRELLAELAEIDEDEAKKKAAKFLNVSVSEIETEGGRLEDGIELISVTNGECYIDVTKRGGILFRMISQKAPESAEITIDDAIAKVKNTLSQAGFNDVVETYHMRYGNTLAINFAAKQGSTVIYPDLVKITVSLQDGSIINFDAAGYVKNHKKRTVRDISESRSLAQSKVSKDLKILSYSPAIIPTDGTGEMLTHEFKCETSTGEHCIVYINVDTLHEEKILILIEDENGTLVM